MRCGQNSGAWGDAPTGSGEHAITVVISFGERLHLALPQHAAVSSEGPPHLGGKDLWLLQPRHMANIGSALHIP
jgi:hypothetical protein